MNTVINNDNAKEIDPDIIEDIPPQGESQKTHESDINYLEEKVSQENLVGYVTNTHNEYQIFNSLFEKENQKKIYHILSKYDLRFSQRLHLNIEHSKIVDILHYFKKLGLIILLSEDICLIQKDNTFYLIKYSDVNNIKYFSNLYIKIFSSSAENVLDSYQKCKETFKNIIINNKINMKLNWYYTNSRQQINHYCINEELNDHFIKEAYPYLNVNQIISKYLDSSEPILILIGSPGTGKTRLIRHILKTIYKKYNNLNVAFTSDQYAIEKSELFLNFLFGDFSALVIEDIDYHLKPRKDGNTTMYNFLSSSNSIVINYFKNKKMILSTNLPDVKNIDDALIRPGRCFDIIKTRSLNNEEAKKLLRVIGKEDKLLPDKKYTIAEIFNNGSRNEIKKYGF